MKSWMLPKAASQLTRSTRFILIMSRPSSTVSVCVAQAAPRTCADRSGEPRGRRNRSIPDWSGQGNHGAGAPRRCDWGSVKGISAIRSAFDADAQTWAGLDRSYHFLRLRDLGHFRRLREAFDRRPQHGVDLRVDGRWPDRASPTPAPRAVRSCACPAASQLRWRSGKRLPQARNWRGRARAGFRRGRDATPPRTRGSLCGRTSPVPRRGSRRHAPNCRLGFSPSQRNLQ